VSLPTLVERLAKALWLNVKAFPDPEVAAWAANLLDAERWSAPRRSWLPFHRARLLIAAGRPAEARDDMAALVRFKPRDFWSWAGLAETFPAKERENRLACLCRAMQCSARPEYLIQVREALGLLLLEMGRFAEARRELEYAGSVRETKRWRIPPELAAALARPEIRQAKPPGDNQALYASHARDAERLVWTRCKKDLSDQVGGSEKS
jgi:predicted Zn-dependent protease